MWLNDFIYKYVKDDKPIVVKYGANEEILFYFENVAEAKCESCLSGYIIYGIYPDGDTLVLLVE